MLKELIEQKACDMGVALIDFPFNEDINAAYYRVDGCQTVAAVSTEIKDPYEWNTCALHEIEHCKTCDYDLLKVPPLLQHKYEAIADRAMLRDCMPFKKIIRAYSLGARCAYEFADYLEITACFFLKGLKLYGQIYGSSYKCFGHLFFFDPFDIKRL